ncbi:MAG: hypothetical protein JO138_03440 [Acidobacteriaceae bacterium]|nr:hypothetical protein [Acidobacteriaceae bacterium]
MNPRNYVAVVSGMPRSGTSLMMQMLNSGGLPVLTDNSRAPDTHNPRGYFEYEPVKHLGRDASWIGLARGKAVKIIYRLLRYLPPELEYRVIFVERELTDVFASQQDMLRARGDAAADQDEKRIIAAFQAEISEARAWLAAQPNMHTMYAPYGEIIANPEKWAGELSRFLDGLDTAAMAASVDPRLRHHRIPSPALLS